MHVRLDTLSFGATGDFGMAIDNLVPNSEFHPLSRVPGGDPFFVPIIVDDLIPGRSYRLLHRNTLAGPDELVGEFVASQRSQSFMASPVENHGFWLFETDE